MDDDKDPGFWAGFFQAACLLLAVWTICFVGSCGVRVGWDAGAPLQEPRGSQEGARVATSSGIKF
jgi:hypothetical protein